VSQQPLPPVEFLREVDSTNRVALERAIEGCSDGWAVHADTQTDGRGRHGRSWLSAPNENLHLTVLLRRGGPPERSRTLPLAVGVAVAEALDPHRERGIGLKWPNDLWARDAKLGGILCERHDVDGGVLLVGVGVNVGSAPPVSIEGGSTRASICLRELDSHALGPRHLAPLLRDAIVRMADALQRQGAAAWWSAWQTRDVTRGRRVTGITGAGATEGVALGVEEDGALRVQDDRGDVHRVVAGEVRLGSY
jgi:BirA family biotin operon repressor/biotin-[acetyl-CoA-carboxylase] ligase